VKIKIGEIAMMDSDNLLLLDYDTGEISERLEQIKYLLAIADVHYRWYCVEASQSGAYHVIITLSEPMPLMARVCLQAICQSDPKREAINFFRARTELGPRKKSWNKLKNILFSRKGYAIVNTQENENVNEATSTAVHVSSQTDGSAVLDNRQLQTGEGIQKRGPQADRRKPRTKGSETNLSDR
jgi:hypothetical protein